ncbi:zinc finger and SCAN domain-containing protein 20-like [Mytilus californianus]|uniref:zinc finger and SCAN domain-containing protein 20-like n=1 Tax=Mytilus californianus TaxID=6549 RepID=UPI0022475191|nr:zinc finger and SCAN domain-containing protein 20-like [Mytilus californianus]
MGGLGYLRTAPECRQRIKTLKRNYFNAKNSNKSSGNGRTTCRYYDELEDILGGRPAVTPPKVRDSSENHSSRKNSSVECSEPEDEDASGKIRKSNESLMAMLKEQQKEFLSNESKRWEEEKAREEKMRKEDKEHELKLFSMFATILKGQPSSQITSCHASSVSSFPSSSFQD